MESQKNVKSNNIRSEMYHNRDLIPDTVETFSPLMSSTFNKGKMLDEIQRMEGKELNIDFAIPQSLFDELLKNGIDPTFYVFDYSDSNFGKPLNLLERYFKALCTYLQSS
jgi:hypothetical protein